MELMEEKRVFNFNFRQDQYLYDNWCAAFIEAVRKEWIIIIIQYLYVYQVVMILVLYVVY